MNTDNSFFCKLSSINLFDVQTVVISGGKIIAGSFVGTPGFSHSFSITCYDTAIGCYGYEPSKEEIVEGLREFRRFIPDDVEPDVWRIVDKDADFRIHLLYYRGIA